MKVNQNSHTQNMQFGMAIHSNANVNKILKSRIKSSAELQKLNSIIDKQAQNKIVDITLFANPDNTLSANAYTSSSLSNRNPNEISVCIFKSFNENFITKMFGGVTGFIEKVAKYADKQAIIEERRMLDFDKVLKKITKPNY